MALFFLQSLLIVPLPTVAQNAAALGVMCAPDKCIVGYPVAAYGAQLLSSVSPAPIHLLPGQYTSNTTPPLLHAALTSPSTTLTSSAGLPDSLSLPLDLSLQPGLAFFSEKLYSGQFSFSPLPLSPSASNSSLLLAAKSLALSSGVVAIVNSNPNRIVVWDSIPDFQQLPLSLVQLSEVDIQSTACAPTCSSAGTCTPDGKCVCLDGFIGPLCEDCAPGHFGPNCQKCEGQCDQCDEGISGTGRCLKKSGNVQVKTCSCLSGVCGPSGQCQCTDGFVKADNGTQCAKCAVGFFETSTGDCKVCQVGCTQCTSDTCLACESGYSQDPSDRTKCIPPPQIKRIGAVGCPTHTYARDPLTCDSCDATCGSCSGGASTNCTSCAQGHYMLNNLCVQTDSNGICKGSSLFADNTKKACDSCGAKCISCKIANFDSDSLPSDLECTRCIPGVFLFSGKCVDACPNQTFISPQDNITCQACDPSCSTCADSPTFCLSCSESGQLVSDGKCVAATSCPKNTFASSSSSSCLSCHPDCATCTGSRFNECTSCPPTRPVLSNGRCMPTCAKNEYWENSSGNCRSCDSSCGSCSGPDSSDCLSCSQASDHVLRAGACTPVANICKFNTSVIQPLGACFSELITIPRALLHMPQTTSATSAISPIPSISGLNQSDTTALARRLKWWHILLLTFGVVFVLLLSLLSCRRWFKREEKKHWLRAHIFANMSTIYHTQSGEKHDLGPEIWHNDPPSQSAYAHDLSESQGEGGGGDILSLLSYYGNDLGPRTPPAAQLDPPSNNVHPRATHYF